MNKNKILNLIDNKKNIFILNVYCKCDIFFSSFSSSLVFGLIEESRMRMCDLVSIEFVAIFCLLIHMIKIVT